MKFIDWLKSLTGIEPPAEKWQVVEQKTGRIIVEGSHKLCELTVEGHPEYVIKPLTEKPKKEEK